jgi:hypothetical protein
MKIHLVEVAGSHDRLVKAHTRAGAEKYVRDSMRPHVAARVPSQDDLVRLLRDGVQIEDPFAQEKPEHHPINQTDEE